ncbi:MAG: hypothetical protein OJI70_16070 [Zavarzinia sp.]|nr:hypothetical protein [Zavarzinia sp.]
MGGGAADKCLIFKRVEIYLCAPNARFCRLHHSIQIVRSLAHPFAKDLGAVMMGDSVKTSEIVKFRFRFRGLFYKIRANNESFLCRSKLEIDLLENGDVDENERKLICVFMNPGSALPCENSSGVIRHRENVILLKNNRKFVFECRNNKLIETIPDPVQRQVAAVMLNTGIRKSCIYNLSDICEAKSKSLNAKMNKINDIFKDGIFERLKFGKMNLPFSKYDLLEDIQCKENIKIIGWGCGSGKEIMNRKNNAIEFLNRESDGIYLGDCKSKNDKLNYYYPVRYYEQNYAKNWVCRVVSSVMGGNDVKGRGLKMWQNNWEKTDQLGVFNLAFTSSPAP